MSHRPLLFVVRSAIAVSATVLLFGTDPSAQDRLRSMPGYDRFQKISAESRDAVESRDQFGLVERTGALLNLEATVGEDLDRVVVDVLQEQCLHGG